MSNRSLYISVAGNIGSGKSSFTTVLANQFKWKAFYEIVETNPYLNDFYSDMRRWSFHTQIYFLTKRFQSLQEILQSNEEVVQDRSIYEDVEVFAKTLMLKGQMDERDYRTYTEHFEVMSRYIRPPDLMVYLRSDLASLEDRIEKRGRGYERQISRDYLEQLNERYEDWALHYRRGPLLIIDVSRKDFLNRAEDLRQMVSIVKWEVDRLNNRLQPSLPLIPKAPMSPPLTERLA